MDRRSWLARALTGAGLFAAGCHGRQFAQVMKDDKADKVGTHAAGAETYKPLIDESVAKLLSRHGDCVPPPGGPPVPARKRVCFVGVENKSCEEMGDFKEQVTALIENKLSASQAFCLTSRRFVEAGLRQLHLRPDELFVPANRDSFAALMAQQGEPIDYLLFASFTSGTTRVNDDAQRDYLLTLELVNVQTGAQDRESATLRKGYHKTRIGKLVG